MERYNIIIAIDPDVERSGVALLRTDTREMRVQSLHFPDLIEYLSNQRGEDGILVVVEAGWLNKPNWHLTAKDSARIAAAKGNSTGRNHEVGRKIVEMARHYGLTVNEVKPLRKFWNGRDGKITHEELAQFIPDLPKRTTQDVRDAALLAWTYAGLPVRMNVRK